MGQSIPVGPWPDCETAEAFGGNAIKAAADRNGEIVAQWSAIRRPDGLWKAEGFGRPVADPTKEGTHFVVGDS